MSLDVEDNDVYGSTVGETMTFTMDIAESDNVMVVTRGEISAKITRETYPRNYGADDHTPVWHAVIDITITGPGEHSVSISRKDAGRTLEHISFFIAAKPSKVLEAA